MKEQKLTVKKDECFMIYCGKDRHYLTITEDGVEENGVDYNYEQGIARGDLIR